MTIETTTNPEYSNKFNQKNEIKGLDGRLLCSTSISMSEMRRIYHELNDWFHWSYAIDFLNPTHYFVRVI